MIYFDCTNITGDATGAECQKSCQTLDMGCVSDPSLPLWPSSHTLSSSDSNCRYNLSLEYMELLAPAITNHDLLSPQASTAKQELNWLVILMAMMKANSQYKHLGGQVTWYCSEGRGNAQVLIGETSVIHQNI